MPPRARLPKRNYWIDYRHHKNNAKKRNIDFLLTFEEWMAIWEDSGHLHERGTGAGKYVMARYGDKGPYTVGNVRICTSEENQQEQTDNPDIHASRTAKMREFHTGRKRSPETCAKISAMRKTQPPPFLGGSHSEETKEKMRKAQLGKKRSPESKAKMSEARKADWQRRKEKATSRDHNG